MTIFDLAVVAIVGLSALVALFRGLVREVLALVSWVAALILAFAYADQVAQSLAGLHLRPAVADILGFVIVFVGVLVIGGVIAMVLSRAIAAIGLGWLDRLLGAGFGVARGIAVVLLAILIAGATSLPRHEWWQHSSLAAPLVAAALEFRDWLPPGWAARLDFSPEGRSGKSSEMRVEALAGERES